MQEKLVSSDSKVDSLVDKSCVPVSNVHDDSLRVDLLKNNPPKSLQDQIRNSSDTTTQQLLPHSLHLQYKQWLQFKDISSTGSDHCTLANGEWLKDTHVNFTQSLLKAQFQHIILVYG